MTALDAGMRTKRGIAFARRVYCVAEEAT